MCSRKASLHPYKKIKISLVAIVLLSVVIVSGLWIRAILLDGHHGAHTEEDDQRFRAFTREMFRQEVGANTISVHYTLQDPKKYGIKEPVPSFGAFAESQEQMLNAVKMQKQMLKSFPYEKLNVENRLTYDVLERHVKRLETEARYLFYEEPMSLVSGVQTQLPIMLAEYPLTCREDVDVYLELMRAVPQYIQGLLTFEQKKVDAGLFMSDQFAEQVVQQCKAFLEMREQNYLYTTFVDRIQRMEELSEEERSHYIERNALMVERYVLPSFQEMENRMETWRGSGKNEKGLCYFPEGKAYYEHVAQSAVGTEKTIDQMEMRIQQQMQEDYKVLEKILRTPPEKIQGFEKGGLEKLKSDPEEILGELEEKIAEAFPMPPKTEVVVKYVPKALQASLSPAFYMIPAIDAYKENVIYVNEAYMKNPLTLYTTLAHEGYPGHLYQTTYYAKYCEDPIRQILTSGGYVEGWATYAEMMSYYFTPLPKMLATLFQKNRSLMLGVYALADIGIHYHGWDKEETAAFFAKYGIVGAELMDQIYEMILGSPANYVKYEMGYLNFLDLKKEWIKKAGDAFSQKEFHDAVLKVGPAPFEIVEKYMWEFR